MLDLDNIQIYQWVLVIGSSLGLYALAPWSRDGQSFFKGRQRDKEPSFVLLTSSLVISWLFAKSITNAANLGLDFGMVGGVAYAAYYLSFLVAGVVIYQLRTRGGFTSIHHFLTATYGRAPVAVFSVLICFRLWNEVWSNTMVIGSYFGDYGSAGYVGSIVVFTVLTLAYTLKGGFASSLLTDAVQMVLFAVLISIVLYHIVPAAEGGVAGLVASGDWTMATGGNLLLVAVLQSLSYPFHDPVMTDRGFITAAKPTFRAYVWAAVIGAICILLFSAVGIYGRQVGVSGQAPVEVAKVLGIGMMLAVNLIMITSAASTLDSTFSSFAKLATHDLPLLSPTVSNGRWAMIGITILGTIPIFFAPAILSATTVSGTMVLGLAPVFLCWKYGAGRYSFLLPVGFGLVVGLLYVLLPPADMYWTEGRYSRLLYYNGTGLVGAFLLFLVGIYVDRISRFRDFETSGPRDFEGAGFWRFRDFGISRGRESRDFGRAG